MQLKNYRCVLNGTDQHAISSFILVRADSMQATGAARQRPLTDLASSFFTARLYVMQRTVLLRLSVRCPFVKRVH